MKINFRNSGSVIVLCLLMFLCFPPKLKAQNSPLTVSGKVSDENSKGLNSVTVQVKGTNNATRTSEDGSFKITVPTGNETLLFSYVGYLTQEIPVKNRSIIDLTLGVTQNTLEDVIVVGYGTLKKSDVTGALTSISAKTIQERPVTNVLQALQGKAAGINVASNIKPGELPIVRIRGNRSINASNEPLYVVDGIPIVSALGVTSFSLNDISPNDIASMEILKDASATAIYGSRGANGVILISTKKGSKGKISVNFSSNVSFDSYKSLTKWIDGAEYIDRLREALINGRSYHSTNPSDLNIAPTQWYADPALDSAKFGSANIVQNTKELLAAAMMGYERNPNGTVKKRPTTPEEQAFGWGAEVPIYNSGNIPSFNWLDAASRQGMTQNHQVSLSSGTENTRLYLSLGYNNQKGVQKDQDFQRFNLNMNGEITATKWMSLGISMLGSLAEQDFGLNANQSNTGSKDLYSRAMEQFPWAQPIDANGVPLRNPGGNLSTWNPLIDIDQSLNNRRTSSVLANIFSEVKFTPWLKYRINFGAQLRSFRSGSWTGPDATSHLGAVANSAGYSKDENFSWVAENLLYFDKTFAKVHTLGVTLLQSAQKSRRENISTTARGTVIPLSYWYDLASNTQGNPFSYGTGFTENTLHSYMGRLNYNLMSKYLLTASARFDGSSVLAKGHKWDFFPSFALAWKMQEEGFINAISWIKELKPRIGFGVTGNSSVEPYTTTGPLSRNPYVYSTTTGTSVPAIGFLPLLVQNPDLGWEKTAQWNFGLDFSLFKSRISGSIEYYDQLTSDLIYRRDIPVVSGYAQKLMNIGKTRNRGIEITLSTINIQRQDFSWNTELNFSRNREEIVELINGKQDLLANRLFIGQPTQVFYQLEHAGIWQNTKEDLAEMAKFNAAAPAGGGHTFRPGTVKVVDRNGDYRISAEDYVIRGTPRPKWFGGITNTFKYKNLSLSSFMYARIGQTYFGGYPGNFGRVENDIWSWKNSEGYWPMRILGNTGFQNVNSAMQYQGGSFVVVRNISLMYDLPLKLLNRVHMKNLQINVQVLNPFIFGGEAVKMGINPDDETNWSSESQPNSFNTNPVGGVNNNTILPQSIVFGLRAGF